MLEISCPLCGSADSKTLPYPRGKAPADEMLEFDGIRVCGECGLGMAQPPASQATLDNFYERGAYWGSDPAERAQSTHARNQARHRAAFLLKECLSIPSDGVRVLDVGAGAGWLGEALAGTLGPRLGSYDYVEPDPRQRDHVAAFSRVPGRGFAALRDASGEYDVIFLNQVLEHVAEPMPFVRQAACLLRDGGALYIETPNADHRFKDDVFPHTLFFTTEAMLHLAKRCGLLTATCESFGRSSRDAGNAIDLAIRAGLRLSLILRSGHLGTFFDDAYWQYPSRADGIWVRWLGHRGSSRA